MMGPVPGSYGFLALLGSALAMLAMPVAEAEAQPTVLYDVDFGSPPHTVGAEPVVGFGAFPRPTPTLLSVLGAAESSATVVSAFGALSDQPLVLEGDGGESSNVTLELALPDAESYHVELDLIVDALPTTADDFVVFIDAPSINRLVFEPTGDLRVFNSAIGTTQTIGTFAFDTPLSLAMDFDQLTWSWSIALNGSSLFTGPAQGPGATKIRLVLARFAPSGTNPGFRRVALDDLLVTAVPEPARALLLAAAIAATAAVATFADVVRPGTPAWNGRDSSSPS